MLHGCTQDAASFAAATRMNEAADRHGFVVVYPQQERGENPQACWNWFSPDHQARGAGEPASIAAVVRELVGTTSAVAIDARRVFVAGMSAGGAMAAILGATYPDLFAAVAVHSGLAYGSATGVGAAFSAMARGAGDPVARGRAAHAAMGDLARPVPSIVVHGTADATVAPINGDQVLEQSMAANRLAAPGVVRVRHPTRPTSDRRRAGSRAAIPTSTPDGRTAAASSRTSCCGSRDWATHGPAARPEAPTPTRAGPTRPRRSGASSQRLLNSAEVTGDDGASAQQRRGARAARCAADALRPRVRLRPEHVALRLARVRRRPSRRPLRPSSAPAVRRVGLRPRSLLVAAGCRRLLEICATCSATQAVRRRRDAIAPSVLQ